MIETQKLNICKPIKEKHKNSVNDNLKSFFLKYEQYQSILVAVIEKEYWVIDGTEIVKLMQEKGLEKTLCFNIGEISRKDFVCFRLMFNANSKRLDYLSIAELINEVSKNKIDAQYISNKTGLDIIDVERYMELLDFDWSRFEKEAESQYKLF